MLAIKIFGYKRIKFKEEISLKKIFKHRFVLFTKYDWRNFFTLKTDVEKSHKTKKGMGIIMKKMIKKACTITLAVSMLATFVACNSDSSDSQETNGNAGTTAGSNTGSTIKVSEKGVLPIVDEPITITVFTPQVSSQVTDYYDNKLTQKMFEDTNIQIEWIFAPEKDAKQKVNLLLSTGDDLPDVIMGQNLGLKETMLKYGEAGTFIDLAPYLETQGEYYGAALEAQPRVVDLVTAPGGAIYNMPLINPSFPNSVSDKLFINKVWLDNLGLDMPQTTEEFRDVLMAFKTQDPNGNGINDEIPLMGATTGWNTSVETFLLNSFLQYSKNSLYNIDENGKVYATYVTEEYKEGIKYINSLINDGLLDPTSYTQDIAQLKQLFENTDAALIGAVAGGGPNTFANLNGERYKDYEMLPPLEGPEGVRLTNWNPDNLIMHELVITSACEHPEAVFKFFDYMYSPEISMFARNGEEGTDWVPAEEGELSLFGEQALFVPILKWGPPQNSHWAQKNPGYSYFTNHEIRSDDPYELQRYLFDASEQLRPYLPDESLIYPNFMHTTEDSAELARINQTLTDFINDHRVRFITGALDIDAEWDTYMENLEKIGYTDVIDILQGRLDLES